jgi:hypothetical protein
MAFAAVGTVGLVLLSILDVAHYYNVHQSLLIIAMLVLVWRCARGYSH